MLPYIYCVPSQDTQDFWETLFVLLHQDNWQSITDLQMSHLQVSHLALTIVHHTTVEQQNRHCLLYVTHKRHRASGLWQWYLLVVCHAATLLRLWRVNHFSLYIISVMLRYTPDACICTASLRWHFIVTHFVDIVAHGQLHWSLSTVGVCSCTWVRQAPEGTSSMLSAVNVPAIILCT